MPNLLALTAGDAAIRANGRQPTGRARTGGGLVRALNAGGMPGWASDTPNGDRRSPVAFKEAWGQTEGVRQSLAAALDDLDDAYQRFVKRHIDPFFQGRRHALLDELSIEYEERPIDPEERRVNRQLGAAVILTTVAVVTTPFGGVVQAIAYVPGAFYLLRDSFRRAYVSVKAERRLTLPTLNAFNHTLLWANGLFLLDGIIFILASTGYKINHTSQVRSRRQLVNIFGRLPRHVWVLRDEEEVQIAFDQLQVGDILVVGVGEMIPIDGVIVDGYAAIDQHRLTGESQPAEKGVGDAVLASTVVLAGRILIRVEKAGDETVAAQIGAMLEKTASYQMSITSKAFQMANRSVTPTFAAAGLAWLLIGPMGAAAITSTMFGLNIMISGPLALRNFLTVATRRGILIKDGRSLDLLNEVDTVIFDKTGTLTLEQPNVAEVHAFADWPAHDVLRYAAALEQRQSHPIARAITSYAQEQGAVLPVIDEARYELGLGLQANIDGRLVRVGSDRFLQAQGVVLRADVQALQKNRHALGHSLVMVAVDDTLVGAIELQPTIRPEAQAVIDELRRRGLDFYIISGDQEGPTESLARALGIDNYSADTLPENKAQIVEQLQREGRAVCFVGDGINDSIALKKANVSISLRGSTMVAMDTAQIVLMDTTLTELPMIFQLADEMADNLKVTRTLAVAPTLGIWAGVFLLNFGVLQAAGLFEISLWVGIANAMRPLWKHKDSEGNGEEESDEA